MLCSCYSTNNMGTQRKLIHNLFPQRDIFICKYTPLVLFGNPTFPYSVLHFMLLDGFILSFLSQTSQNSSIILIHRRWSFPLCLPRWTLLFLKHVKLVPATGSLHLLSLLPRIDLNTHITGRPLPCLIFILLKRLSLMARSNSLQCSFPLHSYIPFLATLFYFCSYRFNLCLLSLLNVSSMRAGTLSNR